MLLMRWVNTGAALLQVELLALYDAHWALRLFRVALIALHTFLALHAWGIKWTSEKKSVDLRSSQSVPKNTQTEFQRLMNLSMSPSLRLSSSPPKSEPPQGPVKGWRAFDCFWTEDGYKLRSVVVANCEWDGPVMQDSAPPDSLMDIGSMMFIGIGPTRRRQGHGFHSVRTRGSDKLPQYGDKKPRQSIVRTDYEGVLVMDRCSVLAEVENFGGIVEYEDGWKAQGQAIQRLIVPCADVVADLERRYQCEVEVCSELHPASPRDNP